MKFCSRPFYYFYVDNYKGDVALCPWMQKDVVFVGNLNEKDANEIWQGEKATALRNYMRNGDFSCCRLDGCPFLQNDNLPEVSEEEARTYPVSDTPTDINLAYDFICNQYCTTCRPYKFKPILPRYSSYMKRIHEQILPFMNKAHEISASGHGDPFASPYMMHIFEELCPNKHDMTLRFETNGVYFDERHWQKLDNIHDQFINIIITVNSYNKYIYEHISLGGKYDKLMHNLAFARELRKKGDINRLDIAMVIQDRNFREIPEFIERSINEFDADVVTLRPVYQWGTMPEDVFWFKDVLNPMHPYHQEYLDILDMPIMNNPRVFNFGGHTMHPARPFPGHTIPTCN